MQLRQNAHRSVFFWNGWNLGIEAAWQRIADLPESSLTAEQQQARSVFLSMVDNLAVDEELLKPRLTNGELAKKYAISLRTVLNWRRTGCPFTEGQWKVLDWIAQQRIVPAGARAKFSRQLQRRKGSDPNSAKGLALRAKALLREAMAMKRLGAL